MIDQLRKLIDPLKRRISMMVGRAVIKTVSDSGDLQLLQLLLNSDEIRSGLARIQEYGFTSVPMAGAEAAVLFLNGNRDHGIVIGVEDRRYRLKGLSAGEVALYDDQGQIVKLKRAGIEISTPMDVTVIAGGDVDVSADGDANIAAANVNVDADTATVTAPTQTLVASAGIVATTPLLAVSGLISCSGIAAGGATPVAGKAKITGDIEASGEVQDGQGTMDGIRTKYNTHTHGAVTGGVVTTPTPTMP